MGLAGLKESQYIKNEINNNIRNRRNVNECEHMLAHTHTHISSLQLNFVLSLTDLTVRRKHTGANFLPDLIH